MRGAVEAGMHLQPSVMDCLAAVHTVTTGLLDAPETGAAEEVELARDWSDAVLRLRHSRAYSIGHAVASIVVGLRRLPGGSRPLSMISDSVTLSVQRKCHPAILEFLAL
jgi:hypothetical protein